MFGYIHAYMGIVTMGQLKFPNDEAFKSLRVGDIDVFHKIIAGREAMDLMNCDLRGTDFRGVDLSKVTLMGAYLRDADFRGKDLSRMNLQGCSIKGAKISGVLFPDNISVEEIRMSLKYGTRLRTGD